MADRSASNYSVGSGNSIVNMPASAYYPKQGIPTDAKARTPSNLPPMKRIQQGFDDLSMGNLDLSRPDNMMDDSGR